MAPTPHRHAVRTGHYADRAAPYAMLAFAPALWTGSVWAMAAPALATGALAVLAGLTHTGRLCETCAAEFPLDGSRQADRLRARLRALHRTAEHPLATAAAATVGLLAAGALSLRLAATLFALACVAGTATALQHNRLRAWCPWCAEGTAQDGADTRP